MEIYTQIFVLKPKSVVLVYKHCIHLRNELNIQVFVPPLSHAAGQGPGPHKQLVFCTTLWTIRTEQAHKANVSLQFLQCLVENDCCFSIIKMVCLT